MTKTKPQEIDPRQVQQFLADAGKKAVAARKNLVIDEETAYQSASSRQPGETTNLNGPASPASPTADGCRKYPSPGAQLKAVEEKHPNKGRDPHPSPTFTAFH